MSASLRWTLLFVMAQHIVRVKFGIIFSVKHEDDVKAQCNHCSVKLVWGSNLKAFGSRSYSDETSRHVGYKSGCTGWTLWRTSSEEVNDGIGDPTISAFLESSHPLQKIMTGWDRLTKHCIYDRAGLTILVHQYSIGIVTPVLSALGDYFTVLDI